MTTKTKQTVLIRTLWPLQTQKFGCSNTLQAYRSVSIYALLFKSPCQCKEGFIKGETLRLLRTNSVKEIFELRKLEFLTRLLERGYPRELAENILAEVKFSSRYEALQSKTKTSRNVLPFITTFNPATPNLKKVLMKHWHFITESNRLDQIYS